MLRFLSGVGSALLLVAAGFFIWKSRAENPAAVPPAPAASSPMFAAQAPFVPPAASEKSKEERRFSRADKNRDGRIEREELLEPRRKAFAKLDANNDGRLSFEEWAVKTIDKFNEADRDRNGALVPAEYATTAPKPPATKKCAC